MDTFAFTASLLNTQPPHDLPVYLLALWYDGKGDWEMAHNTIQDVNTQHAAWIYAYLHRKEGDIFNADYWYSKAGKKRPSFTLQQEWDDLVQQMAEQE